MSDKELLEFAAKAAGIDYRPGSGYRVTGMGVTGVPLMKPWNPLTDNGDALWIAVTLGVIVGTYAYYTTVDFLSPNERIETVTVWHSEVGGDKYAATRLAIVRAAAELGKIQQ